MPLYRDPQNENLYHVEKVQTCSGHPLEVVTASGSSTYVQPAGMAGDAFGRTRVSAPLTLFDSSHRYNDNGLWSDKLVLLPCDYVYPRSSTVPGG